MSAVDREEQCNGKRTRIVEAGDVEFYMLELYGAALLPNGQENSPIGVRLFPNADSPYFRIYYI